MAIIRATRRVKIASPSSTTSSPKGLFIDGKACPDLLLALKKCELKNGKPVGKYAHITDALGYALWWLEPRPKASTGVPKVGTVDVRPDRSNWY